jgi:hypothetical protein
MVENSTQIMPTASKCSCNNDNAKQIAIGDNGSNLVIHQIIAIITNCYLLRVVTEETNGNDWSHYLHRCDVGDNHIPRALPDDTITIYRNDCTIIAKHRVLHHVSARSGMPEEEHFLPFPQRLCCILAVCIC